MVDEGGHADLVDTWLARSANVLSASALRRLLEIALSALWARTKTTLGEVTLTAIGERVLYTAVERFPFLASFRIEAGRGIETRGDGPSLPREAEVREGARFLLSEFLSVLGNLTAEILTAELHAELMGVVLPPGVPLLKDGEPSSEQQKSPPTGGGRPRIRDDRQAAMTATSSVDGLAQAHQRLERLYEISTLFTSFRNVDETFDPVLAIASKTLSLRSAVLVDNRDERAHMFVWGCEGQSADHMRAVKAHVRIAHRYLVGGPATPDDLTEQTEMPPLCRPESGETSSPRRLIVLPLAVAHRPPFGALQIEGAAVLHRADLMFVNAVANQLAVALDRDRAWRRDIVRREHAEEGQANAETLGATSERHRLLAEISSDQFEALAAENARLLREAQQSVQVREQILAIVSHDLRNPLSTILMTAGVLAKRGTSSDAIGRIRRAADRMLRLIEDLLDFASIEVGTLAIRRQPENASALVREIAISFEAILKESGLELRTEVAPLIPTAFCDRDRVIQVLSNLVGNASKATLAGGHIVVRVEPLGTDLMFAVADDGPGISDEDVKHLFERYWRGGQAEYRGTGLGLAISKGIVAAHGGRLWVETTLGHGATFFFTIPAAGPDNLA